MNAFQSLREYENFIYTFQSQVPAVVSSTLIIQRRGRFFGELSGEIVHSNGCRLIIYERLTWETGTIRIAGYGYEAWRGNEKLYWYDSQPHPSDPTLASTHPHHKHIPPDLRNNRVPAPGLSFASPNLLLLIDEIGRQKLA
jgi:hypothetical protein